MRSDRNWSSWQSTRYPGVLYRERTDGRVKKYAIDYRDGDGIRRRQTVDGGLTEAKKALADITRKARNERPKKTNVTLAEMFEKWLSAPRRNGDLADGSRLQYRSLFKLHVPDTIKRKRLSDITEEDMLRVVSESTQFSRWTQCNVFKTVSGPLRLALRKGYIARSPAASLLTEERPQRGEARQNPLSAKEIQSVLAFARDVQEEAIPGNRRGEGGVAALPLLQLAIYTGARQSELLGLRWKDIDFDRATVRIEGQATKKGEWTSRTKSKKRTVYVSQFEMETLAKYRRRQPVTSGRGPDDFVFAAASGLRPISQEWARKIWTKVRDGAGVGDHVRFHDLRHTFAAFLIDRGATTAEVADQLGDSVVVVLQTYSSLFSRQQSETKLRGILEANHAFAAKP